MNPVPLLTADEAAALLGMDMGQFRFYGDTLGFIKPMDTPVGPRYREDDLLEFRAATRPGGLPVVMLKSGEAAHILGVDVRTLANAAKARILRRDARGRYYADEVHALNRARAGRKTLRVPEYTGPGT